MHTKIQNDQIISILKNIIFKYLNPEKYSVFIFGSRAAGKNKKYSDIDVGIEGENPLDFKIISLLNDAFEESNLPYTVDVVDFTRVSDRFKKIAKKDSILLR